MGVPYVTDLVAKRMISQELQERGISNPINYWNATKGYIINDLVIFEGELYKSLTNQNVGHNPLENSYWLRLQHVIEYKDTLPQASEKSVTFVEVNGQLYYKTSTANSNGYEYKPITSGSPTPPSDGITDVWVDNKSVVVNRMAIINSAVKVFEAIGNFYTYSDQNDEFKSLFPSKSQAFL